MLPWLRLRLCLSLVLLSARQSRALTSVYRRMATATEAPTDSSPYEWSDKVVVITGASKGIGGALAKVLAPTGACLVLTARGEEVRTVAAECGANAIAVQGDVTLREHHTEVLQAALKRFGHVDVWVNNAGQGMSRFVEDLTDDDLDTMILVNVKSALYGMQTVLPHFKERRCGHIINVSSLLGRMPLASVRAAYSASKHALNALTASLRMDIAAQGFDRIIVSTVTPGPVATEFGVNAVYGGMDNRTIPGSQDPHEVAQVIAETMEHRKCDVYTRPQYKQAVVDYFSAEKMEDAESRIRMRPPQK